MRKRNLVTLLTILLFAALALGACGGNGAAEPEEAPAGAANPVDVELVSFEIHMPESIPAGPTAFTVTNSADIAHNFEIEGQGIEEAFESDLQPGETRTMQVDLQPGTYEVYCPVDGHREQGMELELTVTGG